MNRLDIQHDLDRLGGALHAATTAELAGRRELAPRRRAPWKRPRWIAGGLVAAALAGSGGAALAGAFDSPQQVAAFLPAGTLALQNAQPTCTVVTPGVQYDCVTAHAPQGDAGPGNWNQAAEPAVDPATEKVIGGCRSLNPDGTHWTCYLGQKAVDEKIVGAGFLGQTVEGPGEG
jgi:hypothetical protein